MHNKYAWWLQRSEKYNQFPRTGAIDGLNYHMGAGNWTSARVASIPNCRASLQPTPSLLMVGKTENSKILVVQRDLESLIVLPNKT